MKRLTLLVLFTVTLGFIVVGCTLPAAAPYPYYPAGSLNAKAQQMSDDLAAYIRDWKAGRVPALLPDNITPDYAKKNSWYKGRGLTLKDPSTMAAIDKMTIRRAHKIDPVNRYCLFPDAHCTYMMPQTSYGPFGTTVTIKGQFPHARYFSIQITPPFDERFYCYLGLGETSFADVDLAPDAGSVNPFLVGANRTATNRNYTATIEYKLGNIATICGDTHKAPYYRHASNKRYGSGLYHMGPWTDPNYIGPDGKGSPLATTDGPWRMTALWFRYYLPDGYGKTGFDPLAGVPVPDVSFALPTGEKFICWSDPRIVETHACATKKAIVSTTFGDPASSNDADDGFMHQFGIMHVIINGLQVTLGNTDKKYGRDVVLGATGCGESQPFPGNAEPSESCSNHIKYLVHGFAINTGKVGVICGKLPTFPKTNDGQAIFEGGKQIRYFSITSVDTNTESNGDLTAGEGCSVYDEEIVLDANRNYVICYSRAADRPTNATSAAKVTWVDWGPTCPQNFTCRWLAVYPDWYMVDKTPDEKNAPWAKTAWDGTQYDPNFIGNNRNGMMKEYTLVTYYMTKSSFQGLGTPVTEAKLKTVSWGCGSSIMEGASNLLVIIPLLLLVFANGVWFMRRKR